jgi:hypothetical protein
VTPHPRGISVKYRLRWYWTKRLNPGSVDHKGPAVLPRHEGRTRNHRTAMDGEYRNRSSSRRPSWNDRPRNGNIASRRVPDVWATVESERPPRVAATHSRRPSPSESTVEVPRPALERQITPWIRGGPYIAVPRIKHPIAVSVRIKTIARCIIGRPHITLPRNVVPVAVSVQIAPRRILALSHVGRCSGLRCLFCGQRLIAI